MLRLVPFANGRKFARTFKNEHAFEVWSIGKSYEMNTWLDLEILQALDRKNHPESEDTQRVANK